MDTVQEMGLVNYGEQDNLTPDSNKLKPIIKN